ncbi:uncharacterized protein LOC125849100 [Solanum stenotomum]|uniref:uncharacterized protein LOC125849100 n=1 Tax=Solanum stenotomum TaxID=172797 RepID=UPI0020D03F1B|nr:uncharacterized protein LOC125849100 [Solanum stenotomum]
MKLVNIWNSKLQTQGRCTSTRDGESKEDKPFLSCVPDLIFAPQKTQFLRFWDKMEGLPFQRLQAVLEQRILRIRILYSMSLLVRILLVIHWFLIPLIKNCLEGAKVLRRVDKKFIPIVAGTTLAIIDQHAADDRIFVWMNCT